MYGNSKSFNNLEKKSSTACYAKEVCIKKNVQNEIIDSSIWTVIWWIWMFSNYTIFQSIYVNDLFYMIVEFGQKLF